MAVALLSVAALAPAQTGGGFDLSWSSIDSGGSLIQGGDYKLAAVIGPPESGATASGGIFSLSTGFLQSADIFPLPVSLTRFSLD